MATKRWKVMQNVCKETLTDYRQTQKRPQTYKRTTKRHKTTTKRQKNCCKDTQKPTKGTTNVQNDSKRLELSRDTQGLMSCVSGVQVVAVYGAEQFELCRSVT